MSVFHQYQRERCRDDILRPVVVSYVELLSCDLPLRLCPPAHCQDMRGLPWTGGSSGPQLAGVSTRYLTYQTLLGCSRLACLPAGSSFPDQPPTSSGSAGGMRQHLRP